jgi:predicted TIM-barrel fold metal-dependent hydrolase
MKAAGVDRAILVPPVWVGYNNDKVLEVARRYPDRFAVMGRLGLELPESREKVATWKQQPGMLGVRLFSLRSNTPGWLEDGNADWFWPAAEKAELGVMVYASGNLVGEGRWREASGLKLIIDHMAIPRSVMTTPHSRTWTNYARSHVSRTLP